MTESLSKLEYLKRYTDGDAGGKVKKKKKKIKPKSLKNNIRIHDADIKFKDDSRIGSSDEDRYDLQEEKPTVFALDGSTVITEEYKARERERQMRWAPLESSENRSVSEKQTLVSSRNKDMSPPRRKENGVKLKSQRHDSSDSDASPPRHAPQKRRRHDSSDSDVSLPRPSRKRHDSSGSDMSPPRSRKRHDSSGSDMSPPRSRKRHNSSDSDFSPKRKFEQHNEDFNIDGKSRRSSDDLSPPRNVKSNWDQTSTRRQERPSVISTGKKGGLKSAEDLRHDNLQRAQDERRKLDSMDASVLGKGADTVYRDRKSGKKVDLKFEELKKRKAEEEQLKDNEQFATWGKGVVQSAEYEEKLQSDVHEMSKPLARHKNDADLNRMMREQERDGDPMLAFLTKKKEKSKKAEKPRYKGPAPAPNRFNIWPGYRWDGVDRSNGFEKKRFAAISNDRAVEMEAYKWSTEDM